MIDKNRIKARKAQRELRNKAASDLFCYIIVLENENDPEMDAKMRTRWLEHETRIGSVIPQVEWFITDTGEHLTMYRQTFFGAAQ